MNLEKRQEKKTSGEHLRRYSPRSFRFQVRCLQIALAADMESFFARINGGRAQFLLDAEQLIVFCHTLTSAGSAGLDLAGVQCNSQVCDCGVLSLTGTMRGNSGVACIVGHLDSFQSFGYGTDLIQFDQDGISAAKSNSFGKTLGVGYEEVISYQLNLAAQLFGQHLPAFPVFLIQTILDGIDRVFLTKLLPVLQPALQK